MPDNPSDMLGLYADLRKDIGDVRGPLLIAHVKHRELTHAHGPLWFQSDAALSQLQRAVDSLVVARADSQAATEDRRYWSGDRVRRRVELWAS